MADALAVVGTVVTLVDAIQKINKVIQLSKNRKAHLNDVIGCAISLTTAAQLILF